eukprot:CAMPEP_0170199354 /NCGR_PEP_ID=MMETSP0040_2-20121228/69292_1 /TAXON_ID=641309 /ORGANISM="Lotharella oceanica, Strain CCMP622" /LENGTH=387 /DNA_ID=CAMNT_0010449463 /DNA_START=51 /DNA_END=1216 /DNA_ORIENTATION=+
MKGARGLVGWECRLERGTDTIDGADGRRDIPAAAANEVQRLLNRAASMLQQRGTKDADALRAALELVMAWVRIHKLKEAAELMKSFSANCVEHKDSRFYQAALQLMGFLQFKMRKYEIAEQMYRKLLGLCGTNDSSAVRENLAYCLLSKGILQQQEEDACVHDESSPASPSPPPPPPSPPPSSSSSSSSSSPSSPSSPDDFFRFIKSSLLSSSLQHQGLNLYPRALMMPNFSSVFQTASATKCQWIPRLPRSLLWTQLNKPQALSPLLLTIKGHTGVVTSVGFSPDGKHIVSGSSDQTVRIWSAASGDLEAELKGHTGSVMSVGFSPDGKHIVSGSDDRTVQLWPLWQKNSFSLLATNAPVVVDVVNLFDVLPLMRTRGVVVHRTLC